MVARSSIRVHSSSAISARIGFASAAVLLAAVTVLNFARSSSVFESTSSRPWQWSLAMGLFSASSSSIPSSEYAVVSDSRRPWICPRTLFAFPQQSFLAPRSKRHRLPRPETYRRAKLRSRRNVQFPQQTREPRRPTLDSECSGCQLAR